MKKLNQKSLSLLISTSLIVSAPYTAAFANNSSDNVDQAVKQSLENYNQRRAQLAVILDRSYSDLSKMRKSLNRESTSEYTLWATAVVSNGALAALNSFMLYATYHSARNGSHHTNDMINDFSEVAKWGASLGLGSLITDLLVPTQFRDTRGQDLRDYLEKLKNQLGSTKIMDAADSEVETLQLKSLIASAANAADVQIKEIDASKTKILGYKLNEDTKNAIVNLALYLSNILIKENADKLNGRLAKGGMLSTIAAATAHSWYKTYEAYQDKDAQKAIKGIDQLLVVLEQARHSLK
jgi:hypothetical protein